MALRVAAGGVVRWMGCGVLAVVLAGPGEAAPLAPEACTALAEQIDALDKAGIKTVLEQGPAIARDRLTRVQREQVRTYLDALGQLRFRCPNAAPFVQLKSEPVEDPSEAGAATAPIDAGTPGITLPPGVTAAVVAPPPTAPATPQKATGPKKAVAPARADAKAPADSANAAAASKATRSTPKAVPARPAQDKAGAAAAAVRPAAGKPAAAKPVDVQSAAKAPANAAGAGVPAGAAASKPATRPAAAAKAKVDDAFRPPASAKSP